MPDFAPVEREPTWGDYIDLFQGGAWAAAAGLTGAARSVSDPISAANLAPLQSYFADKRDANTGEMTPEGRARAQADFGSEEFWKSPTGWTAAQLVGSSPYVLATIVPVALTGGLAGIGGAAAVSGSLVAGDVLSQAQETVDNMSDDELAETSLGFADDILNGMPSDQARQKLIDTMNENKGAMAFALGAGSALLGVPRIAGGAIGRVLGRTPSKVLPQPSGGVIKGGAKEAGIGAGTEYAEEFATSALQQQAQVTGGFQEKIDIGRAHAAGMTGAVVGGVLGGALGGVERFGKSEAKPAKPSTAPPPPSVQTATQQPTGGPQPGFPSRLRGPQPVTPQAGFPSALRGTTEPQPQTTSNAAVGNQPPAPTPPSPPAGAIPEGRAITLRSSTQPMTALPDPITPAPDIQLALGHKNKQLALPPPSREMAPVPPPGPTPPPTEVGPARVPPMQPTPSPAVTPPARVPPPSAIPAGEQVIPTIPPLKPNVPPMQPVPPARVPPMQPVPPSGAPPMQPVPPPGARPMAPIPPANVPPTTRPMGPVPPPAGQQLATIPRRTVGPVARRPAPVTPVVIAAPDRLSLAPPPEAPRAAPQAVISLPQARREGPPQIFRGKYEDLSPEAKAAFDKAIEDYRGGFVTPEFVERAEKRKIKTAEEREREEARAAPLSPVELEALHKEGIRTGKKGEKAVAARVAGEAKAKEIFNKYAKAARDPQETPMELRERVQSILADAKAAGIKIPQRTHQLQTDEIIWLQEVRDLDKSIKTRGKVSPEQAQDFAFRERALKEGEKEIMREERLRGGALKKEAGGVQKAPAPKFEKAKAGAPRKVEITPELRAKYETKPVPKKEELPQKVTPPKAATVIAKAKEVEAKKKPPQSAKQRLAAAVRKVAKKATPAQRGVNARTGLFNIYGMEVAIQYTKGMTREVTTPTQEVVSSVMPAHYGHIKGTVGADGAPIDVYIGPNPDADTVFVVDQVDPYTHEFDEHKVMLGFKDADEALNTYHAVFTDGSGPARTGDVTPMTVADFKAWVAEKTIKDPAGAPPEETMSAMAEEIITEATQAEKPPRISISEAVQKYDLKAFSFSDLRDHLKNMLNAPEFATSAMQDVYPTLLDILNRNIADTPMYLVTPEQMTEVYGRPIPGVYKHTEDAILILDNLLNTTAFPRVVVHEAVHAAFIKAMYLNPDITNAMTFIASEFRNALVKMGSNKEFYAFKNVDEFIAEALSNVSMQNRLAQTPASKELQNWMGDNRMRSIGRPIRTLWDAVRRMVGIAFGLRDTQTFNSLLDAVLQVTAELDATLQSNPPGAMTEGHARLRYEQQLAQVADPDSPWNKQGGQELLFPLEMEALRDNYKKVGEYLPENLRPREGTAQTRVWGLALRTADQIAQLSKAFGPKFGKYVRELANAIQRMHTRRLAMFQESSEFIQKIYDAKRKFAGPQWDHFTDYLNDETISQVYGDRSLTDQYHLGKDRLASTWSKAQHTRLSAEWGKIDPELQAIRNEALDYFKKQREGMALEVIENIVLKILKPEELAAVGGEKVMARKLFNKETLTPREDEIFQKHKEIRNRLRHTLELGQVKGPYYPLIRIGQYVTSGRFKLTPPSDGVLIKNDNGEENEFEFSGDDARKRAQAYAEKQTSPTRVFGVWVDPETGENYFDDIDEEGNPIEILASQHEQGEHRFRVIVQNEYVEFFDSLKDAQVKDFELRKDSNYTPDHLEARQYNPYESGKRGLMSNEINKLLDSMAKNPSYEGLTPTQKGELEKALRELSLRMYGTTRIQARSLPRRDVLGASKEFDKVTLQYAEAMAGYRSKLQTQREIDAARDAMEANVNTTEDGGQKAWAARRAISNEMVKRTVNLETQAPPTKIDNLTNRLTIISFINYLMSPAYSINNLLQVGMLAYPQLAAKYGAGTAARMLIKVYKDVGVGKLIKSGLRETRLAAKPGHIVRHNFLKEVLDTIHDPGEKAALEYLRENGSIAPEAGLEMDRKIGGNKFDKASDFFQGIARAMPAAVETINRVTAGLAAYRLEMRRSGNHQAAMEYAQEVVNLTQGNYSASNMPAFFNHPLGRLAFQFKKYGQTVYGQLGHNFGNLVRGTSSSSERIEAAKALTLMGATHLVMAGALGLPTEPIRWLVIGANSAGLTEAKWEDVENWERQIAANIFGTTGGEVFSRGLPRLLGVDVSQRIGMQNLLLPQAPRSNDEHSMMATVGELLSGAPGGMVIDSLNGFNKLFNGDTMEGIQQIAPVKIASDAIAAYRNATEGKQSAAGYRVMEPTGFGATALRILGYRSAQEAEISERRSYVFSVQQRTDAQRNSLQRRWREATPNDRMKIWGEIEQFNRTQPRGGRLTRTMLQDYKKRRAGEEVIDGFRVTRRNRDLIRSMQSVYATE